MSAALAGFFGQENRELICWLVGWLFLLVGRVALADRHEETPGCALGS